jgi:hypothetical protein
MSAVFIESVFIESVTFMTFLLCNLFHRDRGSSTEPLPRASGRVSDLDCHAGPRLAKRPWPSMRDLAIFPGGASTEQGVQELPLGMFPNATILFRGAQRQIPDRPELAEGAEEVARHRESDLPAVLQR